MTNPATELDEGAGWDRTIVSIFHLADVPNTMGTQVEVLPTSQVYAITALHISIASPARIDISGLLRCSVYVLASKGLMGMPNWVLRLCTPCQAQIVKFLADPTSWQESSLLTYPLIVSSFERCPSLSPLLERAECVIRLPRNDSD